MGLKMTASLVVLVFLLGVAIGDPYYNEFRRNFELRDTNLGEPAYRLKDTVQPQYVYVDLDVYLNESRFNGLVQLIVNVEEDNLTQIVLHQNVVSITAVTVLDANNQQVPTQFPDPFETDSYFELLKINLDGSITRGIYTLIISYLGVINENPFDEGFYRGYYFYNGETRYYATTQFQPYHARQAFPCFDEPQFKSRFIISITRDSRLSPSYSNMAINETKEVAPNRIRETFLPTPIVSAYLVAFHVSDFVETNSTGTADKPFSIISRPGLTDQHAYAAQIGSDLTKWMDDYFGINYYEMGQGMPMKNDHIALPDFVSGAMENWGMVTYREALLLYDEQNTSIVDKIFIAIIMAHELAHKWFGNLVTCFWWSNLWLNEGFASYFEYFSAHGVDPSLELDARFVIDLVHSALAYDAWPTAAPMNWTGVADNPTIAAHFSPISYEKGASVLRMMEHFVGATTFQKAMRYYLRDNAYKITTPEDVYDAFRLATSEDQSLAQYSGIEVGAVFDSWVQNPGSPVLNVEINMDTGAMMVTQERFQLTGTSPATIWQIPITYTRGNNINFEDTKPVMVLTGQSTIINKPPGNEWVIFNVAQSGLYRVNYDDHSWEMIAEALRNERESIHKLNRAQIVDDVLYFIQAGKINIDRAFDILSFLEHEIHYYPWASAVGQLSWIRGRIAHFPALHQAFSDYIKSLMEAAIQHLGYDERATDSSITILNRMIILNQACNLGHTGCIEDSFAKWRAFRENPSSLVPVNLRRYVYCIGLREGDYSDYEFLWNIYNTSETAAEMEVILRTLACTKDQAAIAHYLRETMQNAKVRAHDKNIAFTYALVGNPENLPTVLDFLYTEYATIREYYGGSDPLTGAIASLSSHLTDFEDIVNFQNWLYTNQLDLPGEFDTGRYVVDTAIENIVWGNSVALDLHTYLRTRNVATTVLAPLALILTAVFTHLFS